MSRLKDFYIEKPDYIDTRIDNTKNNPYALKKETVTEDEVMEKQEEEDHDRLEESFERELEDIEERWGE